MFFNRSSFFGILDDGDDDDGDHDEDADNELAATHWCSWCVEHQEFAEA